MGVAFRREGLQPVWFSAPLLAGFGRVEIAIKNTGKKPEKRRQSEARPTQCGGFYC
jgi:hypothetical protein